MQEYPIKRGFTKGLEERVVEGFSKFFGKRPVKRDGQYTIRYGALLSLEVTVGEGGKTLLVDTESDRACADDEVILDTNHRFRQYLTFVTGLSTKERTKKMKQSVEKSTQ
ncbi:MAG: DUF5611 family protein [Methanomicrobiaceae archaeon]|nr:DUF5611 family protein [Methanomicrobiaceae archaeon]